MFGALTLARRGQVERALELGEMVPRSFRRATRADGFQAWLASAVGDAERARSIAAEVLANREATWRAAEAGLAMLEALAALRDWEALAEHLSYTRTFAGALAVLGPTCDRAEGLLRAASGDVDAAVDRLGRSLEAFERLGERYEAARTKEALAPMSSSDKAHELLAEALQCYEDLGAGPDAERVRTLLDRSDEI